MLHIRGYFEYEPVRNLYQDGKWLNESKGKAVKIVAPLLPYLPAGFAYRVILIERQLDEVLESQRQMLIRRGEKVEDTPARRARLKEEYGRQMQKMRISLQRRPETRVLFLNRDELLKDPGTASQAMNRFLGGNLDTARMAAEVDPSLHRQRVGS